MTDTDERARFDAWWTGEYGWHSIRAEWADTPTDAAWMAWRAQAEEIKRLKAALTPSAETKAAYWGEFHFTEEGCDEDGQMYYRKITVPWTTVKEIMAEILARAALAQGGEK